MPNTKMQEGGFRDFFNYHKWIYVLLIVVIWMLTDVLYSATKYQVPNERQVSIQVVSTTVDLESTLPLVAEHALAAGQEYDETLEEVVFYRIAYDPKNDMDGYGGEQYMLMLGVGEGDIYMVTKDLMHVLVNSGYVLPLEGYIEEGVLEPGDVDLESVTFHESTELDNYDPDATHVYAIPMVNMNDMLQSGINYDNREAYMVIMAFSANPETSACVMSDIIAQLTGPLPDWAVDTTAEDDSGLNAFDSALQDAGFATPAPETEQSEAE